MKRNKGITLIVLVITIVIMLILAGVTIGTLVNKDVINLAKDSANKANSQVDKTLSEIEEMRKELEEGFGGDNSGGDSEGENKPEVPKGKPLVGTITTPDNSKNTEAEDKNGNPITIPAGFTVVPNSPEGTDASEKVTYTYNGDGTPAVQDGIVIQDTVGNQFVWIPVGNVKNKDGSTTEITLGRYEFAQGEFNNTTEKWSGTGEPTLKQDSANYTEIVTIKDHYQELTSNSENTSAKNLKDFINSAKAKRRILYRKI